MFFITQQKRAAPSGVDAAETVRFSWKVVDRRGNANTMFALADKCHGWQRKGGPVMVRSTWSLSFRKSTVVASIRVRGGQPFLRGF